MSCLPAAGLVVWLAAACAAQDFTAAWQSAESARLRGGVSPAIVARGYREALELFERLDHASAVRRDNLACAAFAAEQAGEPARAAQLAVEGLAAELGDDAAAYLVEIRVRALVRAKQFDAAVEAVAGLSPRAPDQVVKALRDVYAEAAGGLCEAAELALRQGETDAGLRVFAGLAEAAARHPTALANWALALHHVGRDDEAEARYREALAAAPDDSDLWNDFGLLLKGQRRDAEAMAAFRRSFALDPSPTKLGPAGTNLALMQRLGRAGEPAVDVLASLRGGLGRSPVSAMVRRLVLDELHERRAFPSARPDTGGADR